MKAFFGSSVDIKSASEIKTLLESHKLLSTLQKDHHRKKSIFTIVALKSNVVAKSFSMCAYIHWRK